MRRFLYVVALILLAAALFSGPALSGESKLLGGGARRWDGWTATGEGWHATTMPRGGNPTPQFDHMESSEQGQGSFRSPDFTVQGDVIEFVANGWDGREIREGKSEFLLRLANDGSILRQSGPPQQDSFVPINWYVGDLKGQSVYFEAVDGISDSGFAWLGLANVVQKKKDVTAAVSEYRAIPLQETGTWGVMTRTGGGYNNGLYLSSLGQGEDGTGEIESPPFALTVPKVRLKVRGWDGERGDLGRNFFELCDASTGAVLRRSEPPLSDKPKWIEWDVADLQGRSVRIRLVDSNSDKSFAWMGLDEVDAGHPYSTTFDWSRSLEDWSVPGAQPDYCEVGGVPFLATTSSIVTEDKGALVEVLCRAKRVFLLGMTTSLDQGCPCWSTPGEYSSRFFIGDSVGTVMVRYTDGNLDKYPLILGESAWWGRRFTQFPEPFMSGVKARDTLQESLLLYPRGPSPDGRYLAAIETRADTKIRDIVIEDERGKTGVPVIVGVTVEPVRSESPENSVALAHDRAGRVDRALRKSGTSESEAKARLDRLRNVLYTTSSNFPRHVPLTVPSGHAGPLFKFAGDSYAELLTNILYANLDDISKRVTSDGMYHTSAEGASSWGGYEGFGTYRDGAGSYFTQSWTRDMGRSLGELCAFGYLDEAKRCADYTLAKARVWEDIQGLGDWVVWQLENPEISGSKNGVLRTDSECSGGIGYSIYADVACIEALRALADMAESVSQTEKAAQWRSTADAMQAACKQAYLVDDPDYGKTWTLDHSGWPDRSTVMGPIILPPDRTGFLGLSKDCWKAYNLAAYKRQTEAHKPFGYFGVAMGYGQGFVTQSALLLDRMSDATKMLQWAAKATYSPLFKPYIVPEGCEVHPTGKFWHRTGDLGNGVQQAEIVKALRIVIGIDDSSPECLRICPRLPNGWKEIQIGRYPALTDTNGHHATTQLGYRLKRTAEGLEMNLTSDRKLGAMDVRLGPLSAMAKRADVSVNGREVSSVIQKSGDSSWVRFAIPAGATKASIRVTEARK